MFVTRKAHLSLAARRGRATATAIALALLAVVPDIAAARLRIVTSIPPLAMIATQVGGDHVETRSLINGASTPHSYAPRPSDAAAVAGADAVLFVGGGLDDWTADMIDAGGKAVVVRLLQPHDHDDHAGDGHHEHHDDPHVWLDPVWTRDIAVPAIVRVLSQLDPPAAPQYEAQGRLVRERLTNLEDDIRDLMAKTTSKSFVAFHPAWGHFARRFGLHAVGAIEESGGEEPTLRSLVATMRAARSAGVRAILIEPQLDARVARTLAAEMDATVLTVDPLGDLSAFDRDTYQDLMMLNASVFAQALGVREEDEGQ